MRTPSLYSFLLGMLLFLPLSFSAQAQGGVSVTGSSSATLEKAAQCDTLLQSVQAFLAQQKDKNIVIDNNFLLKALLLEQNYNALGCDANKMYDVLQRAPMRRFYPNY